MYLYTLLTLYFIKEPRHTSNRNKNWAASQAEKPTRRTSHGLVRGSCGPQEPLWRGHPLSKKEQLGLNYSLRNKRLSKFMLLLYLFLEDLAGQTSLEGPSCWLCKQSVSQFIPPACTIATGRSLGHTRGYTQGWECSYGDKDMLRFPHRSHTKACNTCV